jgi:hypothetical protein
VERANPVDWLYEGARHHVANWTTGRLEERSAVIYSSQVLCISVFGALDGHPRGTPILRAIGAAAGIDLPVDAPSIVCEDRSHPNILNEKGRGSIPTSPDVLVRWPSFVLAVESKFREGLGPCGQTRRRYTKSRGNEPPACTGDHARGSDRKTGTNAACRLTSWDGDREPRRYWEVAGRLFRQEVLAIPKRPCPFADGRYQLMRNLCFAAEFASIETFSGFSFLLAYVGGSPSAGHTRELAREFRQMLLPDVRSRFGTVTYEQIAEIAATQGETKLGQWISTRLRAGLAAEYPPGRGTTDPALELAH